MRYILFFMMVALILPVWANDSQINETFGNLKNSVESVQGSMNLILDKSQDSGVKNAWNDFQESLKKVGNIRGASDASSAVKELSQKAKDLQKIVESNVSDEEKEKVLSGLDKVKAQGKQIYLLAKNIREDGDAQIAAQAKDLLKVVEENDSVKNTGNLLNDLKKDWKNLRNDLKKTGDELKNAHKDLKKDWDDLRNGTGDVVKDFDWKNPDKTWKENGGKLEETLKNTTKNFEELKKKGEEIAKQAEKWAENGKNKTDQAGKIVDGAKVDYQNILDNLNEKKEEINVILSGINNNTGGGDSKPETAKANPVELIQPEDKAVLESNKPKFQWNSFDKAVMYEISIWNAADNSVLFNTTTSKTDFTFDKDIAQKGVEQYLWSVRARDNSGTQLSEFDGKNSFSFKAVESYSMPEGDVDWKKNGETLVVPVEFTDSTFEGVSGGNYKELISGKMDEMLGVYKAMSFDEKKTMEELKYDITPLVKLDKTLACYGKDLETEKANVHGNKYLTDAGETKKQYGGQNALKKQALAYLMKWRIPVNRYNHILYLVPGNGGNYNPTDKLWPCSNSANPNLMVRIPFTDKAVGLTMGGVLMGVDTNVATYIHEFGHQLGLPDLYPYMNSHPNRNAGLPALMASGTGNPGTGCCMLGISRKKGYLGYRVKGNWMKDKVKKIDEAGTYEVYSRDTSKSPLLLMVNIKSTWDPDDYLLVELFDKNRLDKNLGMSVKVNGTLKYPKAAVLMFHSDDDDVDEIKEIYGLPKDASRNQKAFLAGGSSETSGIKVTVEEITPEGEFYKAKIKVEYTNSKKPGGFVNTVKGVGSWLWNKARDIL